MNRSVINIIDGVQTSDGAGVKLRRIIGGPDLNMFDPFLLFDHFGPIHYLPDGATAVSYTHLTLPTNREV